MTIIIFVHTTLLTRSELELFKFMNQHSACCNHFVADNLRFRKFFRLLSGTQSCSFAKHTAGTSKSSLSSNRFRVKALM